MLAFFKLIRWPNLLIMAFTQYMVRWFLLEPFLELQHADEPFSLWHMEMAMSGIDFFLLVLSTVMIGAAGYIINDYFDIRIDEVNRPATNMVGKGIKRRVAMAAHMTLNILGAGIGIWLSWKYNQFRVGSFLYITAPALLWFYSTNLKRQFFAGNFVIALLSGLVPLVVALFEVPNIHRNFPDAEGNYLHVVFQATLVLSLFAFTVSLLREIIKDVEDYEGDMTYGCKTMPIVIGIARTKYVLTAIVVILIVSIGWLQVQLVSQDVTLTLPVKQDTPGIVVTLTNTATGEKYSGATAADGNAYIEAPGDADYTVEVPGIMPQQIHSPAASPDWKSFFYMLALVQLPLVYLTGRILTAKGKKDWRFASTLVKLIMVAGVSYLFLYAHELTANVS